MSWVPILNAHFAFRVGDQDHNPMKSLKLTQAILTDSHFIIPAVVFCIGLALLIALR